MGNIVALVAFQLNNRFDCFSGGNGGFLLTYVQFLSNQPNSLKANNLSSNDLGFS